MNSPLLVAGAEGTVDVMKLILQVKLNFILRVLGYIARAGCWARPYGDAQGISEHWVDIEDVNHLGWTTLLEAIVLSDGGLHYQQIIQVLVNAGADVYIIDKEGVTPFQHARQKWLHEIVEILESAGVK